MSSSDFQLSHALTIGQQAALVGHAFVDEAFLIKCKQYIQPEWLSADILFAHIYQQLMAFYDEHKRAPASAEELLAEPYFKSQKQVDFDKYRTALMVIDQNTVNHPLDVLRPKIAKFVKAMNVKVKLKEASVPLNKHNYEMVVEKITEGVRAYNEIDFDKKEAVDFSDAVSLFTKKDEENYISTGCKALDTLLSGGLAKGESLAVLAPTFTGKSRFLITLARHLIIQDKKVLLITHEDNPEKVKRRIISSVIGMGVYETTVYLRKQGCEMPIFPDGRKGDSDYKDLGFFSPEEGRQLYEVVLQEIERAKEILEKNLTFIHWVKSGQMDVETVLSEARRLHLETKSKTGRGFDVFISDYPYNLDTKRRFPTPREKVSYIYKQFNDFAGEMQMVVAYAVQINRNAAKQMKTGEAKTTAGLEDVGESYDIARNAIAAVSLNRNPEDINTNILRIAVIKARDSQQNKMVLTRAAYNECILYGDSKMFSTYGQSLSKGLASSIMPQTSGDTSTLDVELQNMENTMDFTTSENISKTPYILKKIKGLPIA